MVGFGEPRSFTAPNSEPMADTFLSRIPTLSDAELRQYVENPMVYQIDAVEAAVAELHRRGHPIPSDEWKRIRSELERRDAAADPTPSRGYAGMLDKSPASRMSRIRIMTASLLATGFSCALFVYLTAEPKAPNPLGYDPEDTKKYLRELEVYGGKANVLSAEISRWFDGLWHGRPLAFTIACLTVILAFAFWFVSTRRLRNLETPADESGPRSGSSSNT